MLVAQTYSQHSGGWGRIIRSSRLAWANNLTPVINEAKQTKRVTMTGIGEEGPGAWAAPPERHTSVPRFHFWAGDLQKCFQQHGTDVRTFIVVLGQWRQQLPSSRREERKCTEEREVTKREDSLRSGFGGSIEYPLVSGMSWMICPCLQCHLYCYLDLRKRRILSKPYLSI